MLKKIIHTLIVLAFLSGMFLSSPASPAHAATLTVNTLTDENDGSCLDGDCSLRDAIASAVDNDTITFSVTGTITLTAALTVDKNLTITGPGSGQLTLDGNNQFQIFLLSEEFPTNTINISGMTMTKGYANPLTVCGGGAIRSWAFLTMNDVVITNNHAPSSVGACEYPRGGGILFFDNEGSLTLTNSTVSNNSTAYGGGGIYFSSYNGNISLNNVTIDNNQTTEADGGGVEINNALSTVTITNSTFSNNDASGGSGTEGGGLKISAPNTTPTVTIQNSLFSSNTALQDGGGIYIFKLPVTITNSTIADNSASGDGGGLYNYDGTITINSSTIKGNIVSGGGNSEGGGIFNFGNTGTGSITIVNSTLTGNRSTNGKGGAIFNHASGNTTNDIATVNIINSTIVGNSAKNNFGGGGIVASRAAGNEVSTITLSNSILYGNTLTTGTGGENCLIINSVTIVTNNHNLLQNLVNDCTPGVNDVTSALAASAVVNALASNGGTTQTMSLPGGSPAIDAGDNDICTNAPVNNTSQNGVTRPFGDYCDIGAYELGDTTAPTVTSSVRASTNPTNAASVDFTVTFSEPVTGVT
ncbi:MAG: CSLREA domain-containing protein [Anaerolineales bacterium]|nr:CSLREA domain-containing protein [Anaerolineales bacterium]